MRLVDLLVLYSLLGVASAIAIVHGSRERGWLTILKAAATIPVWPLWAPIVLGARTPRPNEDAKSTTARSIDAERIAKAVEEGVEVCAGTALEPILSRDAGARITAEVERAAKRLAEIEATLARPELARDDAKKRLEVLEDRGAPARAIATAKLHLDSIDRLVSIRDRDARALAELGDLVRALVAQVALAKFAGSSFDGAGNIVSEVWARVEGLEDARPEPLIDLDLGRGAET